MLLPPSFGLQKTSLMDYPGKVATVIFFPECNMRCSYCHNSGLILGDHKGLLNRDEVDNFIMTRAPLLGGVVLSGGEPLLYTGLEDFILSLKKKSVKSIKLDTNGSLSNRLKKILASDARPDYIAMDIKTTFASYSKLGNAKDLASEIKNSIDIIKNSGIPYQFRTTVHPHFIDLTMVEEMADMIRGCDEYVLNGFRPGQCLDPEFNKHSPTEHSTLVILQKAFLELGIPCIVPSI